MISHEARKELLAKITPPPTALKIYLGSSVGFTTRANQSVLVSGETEMLSIHRSATGGIGINAQVFSEDGRIVAAIRDNEFHINQNNYFYKKSPDRHTLVIYAQNNEEVLNVRFLNALAISILGVFRCPGHEPVVVQPEAILVGRRPFMVQSLMGDNGGGLVHLH
jgi:hypothetical protein